MRRGYIIEGNITPCRCKKKPYPTSKVITDEEYGLDDFQNMTDDYKSVFTDERMDGECPACNSIVTYDRFFVVTHTREVKDFTVEFSIRAPSYDDARGRCLKLLSGVVKLGDLTGFTFKSQT